MWFVWHEYVSTATCILKASPRLLLSKFDYAIAHGWHMHIKFLCKPFNRLKVKCKYTSECAHIKYCVNIIMLLSLAVEHASHKVSANVKHGNIFCGVCSKRLCRKAIQFDANCINVYIFLRCLKINYYDHFVYFDIKKLPFPYFIYELIRLILQHF